MKTNPILVIGSINMDLVFRTNRYPAKGETIFSNSFHQIPGGKGANQAYTVGKLGGNVSFVGACGNDSFGNDVSSNLENIGIDIDDMFYFDVNTGVAGITIEKDGDNRIIVSQGANGKITPEMINQVEEKIKAAEVLLLQLEIPLPAVLRAIELAKQSDTIIILDPAPGCVLPDKIYSKIDYLLPNEGELDVLLSNYNLKNRQEKAQKLLSLGVKNVIITRGANGVELYNKKLEKRYPARNVEAVDTTAAGDAFAGALALGIIKGWDYDKCINFAISVSAISVTRIGAQNSLPDIEETESMLNDKKEAI